MRIEIEVPDELVWKLRRLAEMKKVTAEEYARSLVVRSVAAVSLPREMTPEERVAELNAWLESIRGRPGPGADLDDSRESIYEGRGE
jgi:predicted transcriptional regulator